MAVATQEIMLGLPPDMLVSFDRMSPAMRQDWIVGIALEDRKQRRKYNDLRRYTLRTEGEDIGPYKSMYASFWNMYRKDQAKAIASSNGALLGLANVSADLTKREVKNAYRRKARKLHPDAGGSESAFKELYAAYRALLKVARDDQHCAILCGN